MSLLEAFFPAAWIFFESQPLGPAALPFTMFRTCRVVSGLFVGLARRCAKYLDEAEKRIELLTRDESGTLRTEPLQLGQDEDEDE